MKFKRLRFILSLMTMMLLLSAEAWSSTYVPGEVLVKLRPGIPAKSLNLGFKAASLSSGSPETGEGRWVLLKGTSSVEEMMEELGGHYAVEIVEPNYIVSISATTPDDFRFDEQWGLENTGQDEGVPGVDVNAPEAWDVETGDGTPVIVIMDTGIDYNHEDLKGNIWLNPAPLSNDFHGYDFANNDGDPMDDNLHGTHCAGIAAARGNNGIGVSGVSWNAKLMAVKTLDGSGNGDTAMMIRGLNYILGKKRQGVNIVAVNASYGGSDGSAAAYEAIRALDEAGVLFVAAAGNEGSDNDECPVYPANYDLPNIISVANIGGKGDLDETSCYGRRTVHLAAPGMNILSTFPDEPYIPESGDNSLFFDDIENGGVNWIASGDWRVEDDGLDPMEGPAWHSESKSWVPTCHDGAGSMSLRMKGTLDLSSVPPEEQAYFGVYAKGIGGESSPADRVTLQVRGGEDQDWIDIYKVGPAGLSLYKFRALTGRIPMEARTETFQARILITWGKWSYAGNWFFCFDDFGVGTARTTSKYDSISGTSMATPFVTGATALLKSRYPEDSAHDIRWRILKGVTPMEELADKVKTGGRLNLLRALANQAPVEESCFPPDGDTLPEGGTLDWHFSDSDELTYKVYLGTESDDLKVVYDGPSSSLTLPHGLMAGYYWWRVTATDAPEGADAPITVAGEIRSFRLDPSIAEVGPPASDDLLEQQGLAGTLYVSGPLSMDLGVEGTRLPAPGDMAAPLATRTYRNPADLARYIGVSSADIYDQMTFSVERLHGEANVVPVRVTLSVRDDDLECSGDLFAEDMTGLFGHYRISCLIGDRAFDLASLAMGTDSPERFFRITSHEETGHEHRYDISFTLALQDSEATSVSTLITPAGKGLFLVPHGTGTDRLAADGAGDGLFSAQLVGSKASGVPGTSGSGGGCSAGAGTSAVLLLIPLALALRKQK